MVEAIDERVVDGSRPPWAVTRARCVARSTAGRSWSTISSSSPARRRGHRGRADQARSPGRSRPLGSRCGGVQARAGSLARGRSGHAGRPAMLTSRRPRPAEPPRNAIQSHPGRRHRTIDARRRPGLLEFSAVEDTGGGIDPEALDSVFEPFFRADEARSGGGSGLGLALAKRIVEALGGRITAASTPDIGSRFAVELPIH